MRRRSRTKIKRGSGAPPHEDAPWEDELLPWGVFPYSGGTGRGTRHAVLPTGGCLTRSAAHGTVWPSESRPHCTTVDFFASVGKETRRADSTAGGNLIKWTPSRGVSSTFPMYDLVNKWKKARPLTSRLDYTTKVMMGTPGSAVRQAAETFFSQLNGHAPGWLGGTDRRSTIAPCPVGCALAGVIKRTPMRGESKGSYGRGDTRG